MGVRPGRLRFLKPALQRWCHLIKDPEWSVGDGPWWYNERASLSILAGALWATGSWAFEEFATQKGKGRRSGLGRGDLLFDVHPHYFMAEAKQCWPALGRDPRSAVDRVARNLDAARRDARRLLPFYGYRRMAIVFISPRLSSSAQEEGDVRIDRFMRAMLQIDGLSLAWAFPTRRPYPTSETGYAYPGAVVAISPLRHR